MSYRPIIATRLATQSCRPNSSVRSSHQSSVAQKPLATTSSGASSQAGQAGRPRAGTRPGRAPPCWRSRGTPCPWPRRPRWRCPRPGRPGTRARRNAASRPRRSARDALRRRRHADCGTPWRRDSSGNRRTRGTSGSPRTEALSHRQPLGLCCSKQPPRPSRGPPDPAGSPCGSPDGPPPRTPPCGFVRRRGPDPTPPCGFVRDLDRRSGLATFPTDSLLPCGLPESGTSVPPCGFPAAPSGSFASVASTAWSEAKCIGRLGPGST